MSLVNLNRDLRDLMPARERGFEVFPAQSFDVSGLVDPREASRPRMADRLIYFFCKAISRNFYLLSLSLFLAAIILESIGIF